MYVSFDSLRDNIGMFNKSKLSFKLHHHKGDQVVAQFHTYFTNVYRGK